MLKQKVRIATLALVVMILALSLSGFPFSSFALGPTVVQTICAPNNTITTSFTYSFGSNVQAGDVIVVVAGSYSNGAAPFTLTVQDGQTNVYRQAAMTTAGSGATYDASYIWYANAASTGSLSITVQVTQSSYLNTCAYELSGVTTADISVPLSSSGSGLTTGCCAVTSFVLSSITIADVMTNGVGTFTPTSGFTGLSTANSFFTQYSTGATGSSTVGITWSGTYSSWVEDAISFQSGSGIGSYVVRQFTGTNDVILGGSPSNLDFPLTVVMGDTLILVIYNNSALTSVVSNDGTLHSVISSFGTGQASVWRVNVTSVSTHPFTVQGSTSANWAYYMLDIVGTPELDYIKVTQQSSFTATADLGQSVTGEMVFASYAGLDSGSGGAIVSGFTSGFYTFGSGKSFGNGEFSAPQASSTDASVTWSVSSKYYGIGLMIPEPATFTTVTTTETVTGFVAPSFANGANTYGWFWGILALLLPLAIVTEMIANDTAKQVILEYNVIIFLFLAAETIASIIGVFMNMLPTAIPFAMGALLGVYIWRGRT